jgi:hypothetical protein
MLNNTKVTRTDVYRVINGERDYQDSKWSPEFDDSKWSIGDWLIFIQRYVNEAESKLGYPAALDSIRKIAGLAVACMEYNGAPERK